MITLVILTVFYFLPTIVAAHRGHHYGGILLLNFFLGWTGIGWIALMLWALVSRPVYYFIPVPMYDPYTGWRR